MNFSNIPFFDNHTHILDYKTLKANADASVANFLHGHREHFDLTKTYPCMIEASPQLKRHIRALGSVRTLTHYMAEYFHCEEDLDVIFKHREKATENGVDAYVNALYADSNTQWSVLDCELPIGHPDTRFPGSVLRLFQMDPLFDKLLKSSGGYSQLLDGMLTGIEAGIKEGYVAVKCHVAERFTMAVRAVGNIEAANVFAAAQMGKKDAVETVYFAIFAEVLLLCRKLDVSIHVHSGSSGDPQDGDFFKLDPLLLTPFLVNEQYLKTKIVLLHGSYPHTRNAALMAHAFPNVYVDYSWTLPWTAFSFTNALEDALALAPHSKIILGTGQHGIPEISWMAAKIARSSLENVLGKVVSMNLASEAQAVEIAEMVMYKNGKALYKLA